MNSPIIKAALGYGRDGLKIFPILEGTKDSPLIKQWGMRASSDPKQIKEWWTRWPNANIGLACGPSGIGVIDSDVPDGEATLQALADNFEGVLSPTKTQRTPRGGIHRFYLGRLATTAGKIGPNVDTRGVGSGNGGYVLLPPSYTDKGAYKWEDQRPMAALDQWVADICAAPADTGAADQTPLVEQDTPDIVERARYYLLNDAPVSKQGAGGDDLLVKRVAPTLKDMGVSEELAGELLAELWNDRCDPPWQLGDCDDKDNLYLKVHNGYLYCVQNPPGIDTPQATFGNEPEPELTGEDAERVKAGEREQAAELAAGKETWDSLKTGWVYVGQQKQFVRLSDGKMWDVDAFEKQFGYVKDGMRDAMGRTPPSLTKAIFACRPGHGLKTFDSFVFMPGQPENYKGDFNQWRKSDIAPKKGDTSLWDEHLAYLFADEAARNRVLNWMAWVYQNPTLHPNHSIMVHGRIQGTGKSVLPQVLAKLLSATPATPLSQHTLELDHNAWVLRTKLAVVEVRAANKKLTDILHDLITGPMVHVDMKGAHDFDMLNVIAFWLETNKADAMTGMDNSDRRHMIESTDGETPLQPKPQAYYDKLYTILSDPAALAAIAYVLKSRVLKGYSGLHRAPSTEAKKAMMQAAADEVEKWMLEHRDEAPLCRSLVTINEVLGSMPDDVQHARVKGGARNRVAEVLVEHFNGENLGKVRINAKVGQPRLWAINKNDRTKSVRKTLKDGRLAYIYLNERWTPTQADLDAMREGLKQAHEDFAADPVV